MINFLRKSLGVEIVNFVTCLKSRCDLDIKARFTKSAFTQARKKIKAEAFKSLSQTLVEEFYTNGDFSIKKWKGFRLLSIDGSQIELPRTGELYEIFGSPSNHFGESKSQVQGRCSVLYDVLNHYVLDSYLAPLKKGERSLAMKHLDFAKESDLIIYDRGYPSTDFIREHYKRKVDFLIRAKLSFNLVIKDFANSKLTSKIVQINSERSKAQPITIRLIKVILPSGEKEILMTSLLNEKKYPTKIFKELYYKRWGVEIFYDELKTKLRVEHFSGYSYDSIMQDFYIAIFVSNIQSLVVEGLEKSINKNSEKKYKYKVNTSLSYGFLKDRIVQLFFNTQKSEVSMNELRNLFTEHLIPIRPQRVFDRSKERYYRKSKPKLLKNYKNVF